MPKVISAQELDAVHAAIAQHPGGVGIDILTNSLPELPRRTLQRRLANLVKAGRIVAKLQGPARGYHVAAQLLTHGVRRSLVFAPVRIQKLENPVTKPSWNALRSIQMRE